MKSKSRNKAVGDAASVPTKKSGSRRLPLQKKRPFVSATFAMTVDGKITTRDFTPVDFTSPEDKLHLFRQRARSDAVIIGHSTLKRDNVRLGVPEDLRQTRIKRGQTPAPLRAIISNAGRIDIQLKIFQADPTKAGPILIFSSKRMPKEVRAALAGKATIHLSKQRDVDLIEMLQILRRDYNVRRVSFAPCSSSDWSTNSVSRSRLICSAEQTRRRLPA
jgi:riboflavin biosynthesis pyrimidine reductase